MESLMATVAQSDKEAKDDRAFLDRKTAKVKRHGAPGPKCPLRRDSLRPISFRNPDVTVERRDDGTIYLRRN